MRILYISQYFPPEIGATQTRAYEMASNLIHMGHSVTMLTEIPNHPSGVFPLEYRGKFYERKDLNGIDVIRLWVYASPKKTFYKRLAFYLSFMINAVLVGVLVVKKRYDVVYATSPPLFVGAAGLALSILKRMPFVFEVRDLWPESAIELGELHNRFAIKWATRLEAVCYRRAKKIIVVTNGIHDHLLQRGIPKEKLAVIHNGSNTDLFQYRPTGRARIRRQLGLDNKFIVLYAGIIGIAQGLETVIQAARMLHDQKDIQFIFVGEGPQKAHLTSILSRTNINNLMFLDEQPREIIPDYLSASDIAIVPLRNIDIFRSALPSKIFDAWACERPVLLSAEGEARNVMEKAQGGIRISPENPEEMVSAINFLKSSPDQRLNFGRNGRRFTLQHYSRQAQAEKLENILISLV